MPDQAQSVFLVEIDVYEQCHIEGVYATVEAAIAANPIPDRAPAGRSREPGWRQEQDGNWWNGLDNGWCATIDEYKVQS